MERPAAARASCAAVQQHRQPQDQRRSAGPLGDQPVGQGLLKARTSWMPRRWLRTTAASELLLGGGRNRRCRSVRARRRRAGGTGCGRWPGPVRAGWAAQDSSRRSPGPRGAERALDLLEQASSPSPRPAPPVRRPRRSGRTIARHRGFARVGVAAAAPDQVEQHALAHRRLVADHACARCPARRRQRRAPAGRRRRSAGARTTARAGRIVLDAGRTRSRLVADHRPALSAVTATPWSASGPRRHVADGLDGAGRTHRVVPAAGCGRRWKTAGIRR